MNSSDAATFLRTVRSALGHRPDQRRTPPRDLFPDTPSEQSRRLLERLRDRSRVEREPLLKRLKTAAVPLNLKVVTVESLDAARRLIVETALTGSPEWGDTKQVCAWRHPLVDGLELATALQPQGIPVITADSVTDSRQGGISPDERTTFARGVRDSFIGVTSADYCVADTATLVLRARAGQPRSVSLVPSIHTAVIRAEQILADLKELYAVLRWQDAQGRVELTRCLTFISGPSKTADIEATLVHGAHGPRELQLIVLAG